MGAGGNPIWTEAAEIVALENVYSDRTLHGEAENARLLTRAYLRSGATIELDAAIETLAQRIEAPDV